MIFDGGNNGEKSHRFFNSTVLTTVAFYENEKMCTGTVLTRFSSRNMFFCDLTASTRVVIQYTYTWWNVHVKIKKFNIFRKFKKIRLV